MDPILIAIIVILCQYPLAMLTLMFMFNRRYDKTLSIIWNIVVIALPFVGVISFWIFYFVKGRKIKPAPFKSVLPEKTEENASENSSEAADEGENISAEENSENESSGNPEQE